MLNWCSFFPPFLQLLKVHQVMVSEGICYSHPKSSIVGVDFKGNSLILPAVGHFETV